MVTRVPSLFLPLPLLPSVSLFPSFFVIFPSLNVQPVRPGRLSEYATSRLDTLRGPAPTEMDLAGTRGLSRRPQQINTARDEARGERRRRMKSRFFGGDFSVDGILRHQNGRRQSGGEHLEWQKAARKAWLLHPAPSTQCSDYLFIVILVYSSLHIG